MLRTRILPAFVLLLALAACTNAPRTDSAVSALESDRESCLRACNASYERCGDTGAARRSASPDVPSDLFGARADCKASLRSCLPRCKGR